MDFAERLIMACEDNSNVPDRGRGMQSWLARKLNVSDEAVRKWFDGQSHPRAHLVREMARLLKVDYVWLSLGKLDDDAEHTRKAAAIQSPEVLAWLSYNAFKGRAVGWNDNRNGAWTMVKEGITHNVNITGVRLQNGRGHFFGQVLEDCFQVLVVKREHLVFAYDFVPIPDVAGKAQIERRDDSYYINGGRYHHDTGGRDRGQQPAYGETAHDIFNQTTSNRREH